MARGLGARAPSAHIVADRPSPLAEWPPTPGVHVGEVIPGPSHGLPASCSSLVGRYRETRDVAALFDTVRLVTLSGIGGIGKTRLSVEVAERIQPGRAFFVDLARATEPALVPGAIALALDVHEVRDPQFFDAVADHLAGQSLLMVLDNCEHVLAAAAAAAERLLSRCGGLRILATSREPLGVAGEIAWPVPPLSLPDSDNVVETGDSESVRLFCERAASVRPDFVLNVNNAGAIAEICRRLDGLPLAIELAAARLESLAPEEIAERLGDRFTLLRGASRTSARRHQSLLAALEWSHTILSPPEQVMFRRLSVFAGGFMLEAAEEVCAGDGMNTNTVAELVEGLVAKSLVLTDLTAEIPRYRLLESVRQFAQDRLREAGEEESLASRHAAWCITHLEGAGALVCSTEECRCSRHFGWERDNVRAALAWAVTAGQAQVALRLATGQVPLWWSQTSYGEALGWLQRGLQAEGEVPTSLRLEALSHAGVMATMLGDLDAAIALLQEQLNLSTGPSEQTRRARALGQLGFLTVLRDPCTGLEPLDESVALARNTGDDACLALTLASRARARMFQHDRAGARLDFSESLRVAWATGNGPGTANALVGLGWEALASHDHQRAESRLMEGLELGRESGEGNAVTLALSWLGELARLGGDYVRSRELLEEALARAGDMRAPYPLVLALAGLGRLDQDLGDPQAAGRRFREALAAARTAGLRPVIAPCLQGLAEVARTLGDSTAAHGLLEEAMDVARRCGDQMALANALAELARMGEDHGEHARAMQLHREALHLRRQADDIAGQADSLEALAGLSIGTGAAETAARLFGAAEALRHSRGLRRSPRHQAGYDSDVSRAHCVLGPDHLATCWAQGLVWSPEEALAGALPDLVAGVGPEEGWSSLTPAERQVVDLVAQGLTTPEVAERLFLSPRTVQSHLRRIFPKLGVASRRQLRQAVAVTGSRDGGQIPPTAKWPAHNPGLTPASVVAPPPAGSPPSV